jgi:Fic family protein
MISHPWSPIADLPDDWDSFARPDIDDMLRLWNDERQHLADPGRAVALQEKLANLWAIETGVIERLYIIDRGTTESLVELGLGALEQFSTTGRLTPNAARLIEDQRAALDFVFAYIKDERPLTLSYIRELHQLLMRHQTHIDAVNQFGDQFQAEVIRGAWKIHPNNPTTRDGSIHEYAPPHLVQDEMDQLITMHQQHLAVGVRPEVEAAWLHHRFTQIHPFQDGNGRVARALATMIFLKAGFVPLVIRDDDHRERYLDALETADAGDLGPLASLFANVVSNDLNDAITFVRLMHGRDIKAIATAAAELQRQRTLDSAPDMRVPTDQLVMDAEAELRRVAAEINSAFDEAFTGSARPRPATLVSSGAGELGEDFHGRWRHQILGATQQCKYVADLSRYRRWTALLLPDAGPSNERWHIVVSFHHKASRADTMAAIVFLTTGDEQFDGLSNEGRPVIVGSKSEFTYRDGPPQYDRFEAWLNVALVRLLEEWQAQI